MSRDDTAHVPAGCVARWPLACCGHCMAVGNLPLPWVGVLCAEASPCIHMAQSNQSAHRQRADLMEIARREGGRHNGDERVALVQNGVALMVHIIPLASGHVHTPGRALCHDCRPTDSLSVWGRVPERARMFWFTLCMAPAPSVERVARASGHERTGDLSHASYGDSLWPS